MSGSEHLELLHDFLSEAGELLDGVDIKLVDLERRPDDRTLLNDIFRGFHTIKGGAGFMEVTALVDVCHRTETLFDGLRNGSRKLSATLLDAILAATAEVRRMFGELESRGTAEAADAGTLAALDRWIAGDAEPPPTPASAAVASAAGAPRDPGGPDWTLMWQAVTGRSVAANDPRPAAPEPAKPAAAAPTRAGTPVAAVSGGHGAADAALRIDVARFDQILNLSGELGLTKNRLTCLRSSILSGDSGSDTLKSLDRVVNQLGMLVADLQNAVMKARMQPVGRVFHKYVRLARDLGRQLAKDVDLVLEGEATEIDKTMLEELNDPLVHLVRNAIDHGVDTPQERIDAGKSARATVRLSARQIGDSIRIEVADDGRGIRADVLVAKARAKGLISDDEAAALDAKSALNLIFLPGFSTKDVASSVSGRGVGMDVVRTNIQKLNGTIDVESAPGRGTCISISLPLTLAILPVLMFRLESQPYAIPLAVVREIVRIVPDDVQLVGGRPSVVMRGDVLPLIDLAALLGRPRGEGAIGIVIQSAHQSVVLMVDSFVGQDEVVIKALDAYKPRGVAGATLANDGTLVLVLDLAEILPPNAFKAAA
ncbi:MAG: chemotaxis protein CheA [Burkholderiales bacterium]|nr:chemotaxis protein CheA [Burkholderiales bacterium]